MTLKKQKSISIAQRLYLEAINKQKQLVKLSKMVLDMGHTLIADVLVTQVNISNKVPTFWHQLLLQNTFFMSLVTKLACATVKQKIDAVVKNPYFKLSANNITSSTLEKFSLEKIESNIKAADVPFFYSLIKRISGVKKVYAANNDKNISATIPLAIKSKEDC